jgi:hypothetical protein
LGAVANIIPLDLIAAKVIIAPLFCDTQENLAGISLTPRLAVLNFRPIELSQLI